MIIKNQNSVKKIYHPPHLEIVQLDNHIALGAPSDDEVPPTEPNPDAIDGGDVSYKMTFPDAPASHSPFGGSSPNYK